MEKKSRRRIPITARKRKWQHHDGVPVLFDTLHPDGLVMAMLPLAPDCPIELRAQLRLLREKLKGQRKAARLTFLQIKCWETSLVQRLEERARKAAAAGE